MAKLQNSATSSKSAPDRPAMSPGEVSLALYAPPEAPDIAANIFGQPALKRKPTPPEVDEINALEPDYDAANAYWTGREAAYYIFTGKAADVVSGYLEEVAAWSDPPDLRPLYALIAKLREVRR